MQLNFLENLFPSEWEQIETIDQAGSATAPSAFSIPSDMIDLVLRMGNEEERTRQQVMMAFMQDKSMDEIADLLKELYGGGNGIELDAGRVEQVY